MKRSKPPGPALLRAFMDKHGISLRKAAIALCVTHPTVIGWLEGTATPAPIFRDAIAKWTDGDIPVESWIDEAEMQKRRELETVQPFKNGTDG